MNCKKCKEPIVFPHPINPNHCDKCGDASCSTPSTGSLSDLAEMYLEECHVSGDSMLDTDHSIDDLPDIKGGSFYVADLMAGFVERMRKENDLREPERD